MEPAPLRRIRALLGLMVLGEGISILFQFVPHESAWLGAGLTALAAALLWRADLPRPKRIPAAPIFLAGALCATGVLAYDLAWASPLSAPKIAIIAYGMALTTAAPFLKHPRVKDAVAWSLPIGLLPIGVWAMQAALKTNLGTTPLEAFTRVGLLTPMAFVLTLLGRHPQIAGQVITYDTPHGPFSLEVGVACSGISAMALFAGILALYALAERPAPRRLAFWSAVGMGGVYLTNVVRLVTLTLVGSRWGSTALEQVHAQAGWMFFVAWTALFAWLSMARSREDKDRLAQA